MSTLLNVTEFSSNSPVPSLSFVTSAYDVTITSTSVPVVTPVLDPATRRVRLIASSKAEVRLVSDEHSLNGYFLLLPNKPEYLAISGYGDYGSNLRFEAILVSD